MLKTEREKRREKKGLEGEKRGNVKNPFYGPISPQNYYY